MSVAQFDRFVGEYEHAELCVDEIRRGRSVSAKATDVGDTGIDANRVDT